MKFNTRGTMQATPDHSQNVFNDNAKSLLAALQNHPPSSFCGFCLYQWEMVNKGSNNAPYLQHPTIDVLTPVRVLQSTTNVTNNHEEDDMAFEDPTISADGSCAATYLPTNDNERQITTHWNFSIVYSETYGVPVLYFSVQYSSGEPCTRHVVLEMLHHHQKQDNVSNIPYDTWEFLSQEQHPYTNDIPSFFLHPCQSSQRLQLLTTCNTDTAMPNILWTWMSMILPTVGHPIPPKLFLDIHSQMTGIENCGAQS